VRRTGLRALLALAALLSCGCQARLVVDVVVDRDGAGELAVALTADAALQAEAAEVGADPLGDLAAAGAGLGAGWTVDDSAGADGSRTVRLAVPYASPEEFAQLADGLAGALAGPELVPLESLRIVVEDEVLRFTGAAGLVPTDEVTGLGVQPEQAVQILQDTEALVYEVRATMAGEVLDSSTPVDDPTAPIVWRIAPGQRVALVATTSRPVGAWWILALSGALGGGAALGLLAVGVRTGRRRGASRG
jgi:hypothetical protein